MKSSAAKSTKIKQNFWVDFPTMSSVEHKTWAYSFSSKAGQLTGSADMSLPN